MKRTILTIAGLSLALGCAGLTGCASSENKPLPASEAGATAGGNGAFGTNPAGAGDYQTSNAQPRSVQNDTSGGNGAFGTNPAQAGDYQPSNSQPRSVRNDTAGGNGAFGENPARPGDYQPGNVPPATNPSNGQ